MEREATDDVEQDLGMDRVKVKVLLSLGLTAQCTSSVTCQTAQDRKTGQEASITWPIAEELHYSHIRLSTFSIEEPDVNCPVTFA